jgi:hypothetical protein
MEKYYVVFIYDSNNGLPVESRLVDNTLDIKNIVTSGSPVEIYSLGEEDHPILSNYHDENIQTDAEGFVFPNYMK